MIHLVGAVLAEWHHEWAEHRRYLGLEVLSKACEVLTARTEPAPEEVSATLTGGALKP